MPSASAAGAATRIHCLGRYGVHYYLASCSSRAACPGPLPSTLITYSIHTTYYPTFPNLAGSQGWMNINIVEAFRFIFSRHAAVNPRFYYPLHISFIPSPCLATTTSRSSPVVLVQSELELWPYPGHYYYSDCVHHWFHTFAAIARILSPIPKAQRLPRTGSC